ncbi:MAG: FmdB family zinc ribbon protein [Candidatus Bipolaricaulia bacterium]
MPLYRYECESCGHLFTRLQSPSGELSTALCDACGRPTTRRLLPNIGIVYKGSGFHRTDYHERGSSQTPGDSEQNQGGNETDTE